MLPWIFYQARPQLLLEARPPRGFRFDELPANVQARVFELVLHHAGRLVHAISRLDPHHPIDSMPATSTRLPHRFHVGSSSVSIAFAPEPGSLLAPLLVCRRWAFLGVHAFYGLNTFAFSSLGEFGRFCKGIGPGRLERLQHVELLWIGSQKITKPGMNVRAYALSHLCKTVRLRTMVVHINETGTQYQRRLPERADIKRMLMNATFGQPNSNRVRAMRTVQGLDYVHQLRGMKFVKFYDFQKSLDQNLKQPIRDWSFVEDVGRVVRMPKVGQKAEDARFENLERVVPNHEPSELDLQIVMPWFEHGDDHDDYPIELAGQAPGGDDVGNQGDNDGHGGGGLGELVGPVEAGGHGHHGGFDGGGFQDGGFDGGGVGDGGFGNGDPAGHGIDSDGDSDSGDDNDGAGDAGVGSSTNAVGAMTPIEVEEEDAPGSPMHLDDWSDFDEDLEASESSGSAESASGSPDGTEGTGSPSLGSNLDSGRHIPIDVIDSDDDDESEGGDPGSEAHEPMAIDLTDDDVPQPVPQGPTQMGPPPVRRSRDGSLEDGRGGLFVPRRTSVQVPEPEALGYRRPSQRSTLERSSHRYIIDLTGGEAFTRISPGAASSEFDSNRSSVSEDSSSHKRSRDSPESDSKRPRL